MELFLFVKVAVLPVAMMYRPDRMGTGNKVALD